MTPHSLGSVAGAFLLAFPALFSIVNPIGAALTFGQITADRSHADRQRLAARIGVYSLAMLLGSLWLGSYVLTFFGITLAALRIAGGLVVASRAWELLSAPERQRARKGAQAAPARAKQGEQPADDVAFFPLTMPFTTGPGTISVAVTLGSERPAVGAGLAAFFIGVTAAAAAVAVTGWIVYRYADLVRRALGETGSRAVTRLVAVLLLCIGVQIGLTGIEDVLGHLAMHR